MKYGHLVPGHDVRGRGASRTVAGRIDEGSLAGAIPAGRGETHDEFRMDAPEERFGQPLEGHEDEAGQPRGVTPELPDAPAPPDPSQRAEHDR